MVIRLAPMNEQVHEYLYVFVYGTLKPGSANFDDYCGTKVVASHRAYIHGELYDLPRLGYPGATHGDRQIYGYVLTFADPSLLQALDELEDYDPLRSPTGTDYIRELVIAHAIDGSVSIPAWTYLMTAAQIHKLGGVLISDGWWVG
jgi:gamma-glutamylcyclotransferase (GGCT)/AIG2-like uncharacterized protein YtfP